MGVGSVGATEGEDTLGAVEGLFVWLGAIVGLIEGVLEGSEDEGIAEGMGVG